MGILQGSYIGISQIIAMIHHDTFVNIPIQKGSRVDSLGCELKPILCFLECFHYPPSGNQTWLAG
jgi:hypothetical protein